MNWKQEEELLLTPTLFQFRHGRTWCRGPMIGQGSFGSVFMATLKKPNSPFTNLPSVMAVKSARAPVSGSLQKEKYVLDKLQGCPNIIHCFGKEITVTQNGDSIFNIFLEYASGGTIADVIKKSGSRTLRESDVRHCTRSVLQGLQYIHECDFVHCDLKPENILLVATSSTEFVAKIGDLGLARRAKQGKRKHLRGTAMYLSPEALSQYIQEPPSDIWALGCVVLEMLTGKKPWDRRSAMGVQGLPSRIASGRELPYVPDELSKEAKDFLKCCFVREHMYRFTAEMLLDHPFVAGLDEEEEEEEEEEDQKVSDAGTVDASLSEADSKFRHSSSSSDQWSFIPLDDSSLSEEAENFTSSSIIPQAILCL